MKVFVLVSGLFLSMVLSAMPAKNQVQPYILDHISGEPFTKTIKGDFLGQPLDQIFGNDLWHFANPSEGEIEGSSINKAYSTYKISTKSSNKDVIVAVLDSGVDVRHKDLQGKLWVNPKEIWNNGIDDDNNGYIDDIFGWNFIGNAKGMATISDNDNNVENGFNYTLGEASLQVVGDTMELTREYLRLTILNQERPLTPEENSYLKQLEEAYTRSNNGSNYYNLSSNSRLIVGDNYNDLTERNYGNNDVIANVSHAFHGTHVAGIIAANRLNDDIAKGIATNVKIMSIRVVPDGDERDKDVANGIRYAVDNGASIINMSFGKGYNHNKKIVDEAVAYAAEKGVILVHAAGNSTANNDFSANFPNRANSISSNPKAEFPNWIEVGASGPAKSRLNAYFSNFGRKTVDLFAPGVQILSLAPGNQYAPASGTSMASPVVAGILAAVMNFVPSITALEAKDAVINSVRLYPSLEVQHAELTREFATLSITGGVADLFNAVQYLKEKGHKVETSISSSVSPEPTQRATRNRAWGRDN